MSHYKKIFSSSYGASEELSFYEESLLDSYIENLRKEKTFGDIGGSRIFLNFLNNREIIKKDELKRFLELNGGKEFTHNTYVDSLVYYNVIEDDISKALEKTIEDERNRVAREEADFLDIDIGMEYEIPVRLGLNLFLGDIGRKAYHWESFEGKRLFCQEDSPITVELKSEPHDSIYSMALEIDRRLEIIEKYSKSRINFSNDSSEYQHSFPGIHYRIGVKEENMDLEELTEKIYQEIPYMGFLSANGPGIYRSKYTLSKRQMKNIDFVTENPIEIDYKRNCIEYRLSDIHRDIEEIAALGAMFAGIQKYHINSQENKGEDRLMVDGLWKKYLRNPKRVERKDFGNFFEKISKGLREIGAKDYKYIGALEGMFNKKVNKEDLDSLDTKEYPL